ncbi:MAG: hypothetical protein EZS28_016811, partial [Streblomastix strix]
YIIMHDQELGGSGSLYDANILFTRWIMSLGCLSTTGGNSIFEGLIGRGDAAAGG